MISVYLTHCKFLKKGDGGANTPISGERAAPFLRDPRFLTGGGPGEGGGAAFRWAGERARVVAGRLQELPLFQVPTRTLSRPYIGTRASHSVPRRPWTSTLESS